MRERRWTNGNWRDTEGALYDELNSHVLEFVGHLRRVHPELPVYKAMPVTWYVDEIAKKLDVKAADLLAPVGTPCYYYHSRTPY